MSKTSCLIFLLCILVTGHAIDSVDLFYGLVLPRKVRFNETLHGDFKFPQWITNVTAACSRFCICIGGEMLCHLTPYFLPASSFEDGITHWRILKLSVAMQDMDDLPSMERLGQIFPELVVVENKIEAMGRKCNNWNYSNEQKIKTITRCDYPLFSPQWVAQKWHYLANIGLFNQDYRHTIL